MARYPERVFDSSLIPVAYPDQAVSDVGAGPVPATVTGIGGLLIVGLGVCNTLWVYGLSKGHPSKTVRTTGYILAGLSALATVVYLVGTPIMMVQAADAPGA